ncbi:MAG TPA: chemotaxis protein CheC [Streptosporangiaceae bacterium]|nr:chemotaxis protein CheC [Streptosporangiaceae bacterium]
MAELAGGLSPTQLGAMSDLAVAGSETAATTLSSLIGRPVELDEPQGVALPVAEAIERCGPSDAVVTAIAVPTGGDLDGLAVICMPPPTVNTLCELLGVSADDDIGVSALCEVGNILGASYLGALAGMTGLTLAPGPPERVVDMLGAILGSAFVANGDGETALLLESTLTVAESECSLAFLFMPSPSGLHGMLHRLGAAA